MNIDRMDVHTCTIPTDRPESDGTFTWDRTTIVIVELEAGGRRGLGYTYSDSSTASLIRSTLADVIRGRHACDIMGAWVDMVRAVRNAGRPGIASYAIAAVDVALWDLKARLLDVPLLSLLGAVRDRIEVYGSGGFTSYSIPVLQQQLAGWVQSGIRRVKMKVGRRPDDDVARVRAAREAIGDAADLFVDANGAYDVPQALGFAQRVAELGVALFEEPVSSDHLEGLRQVRDHAPAGMEIAAGEYGYDTIYFRRMLDAGAVDVIQPDATRCAGVTRDGYLIPDRSRAGLGLELKRADAARYEAA